jgi:Helix-turn-helix domain
MSTFTVRTELGPCKPPPFAQLPHDIAADPRLTPVDVRVITALLFWAREKAVAWPCDRSIASRVGRSVSTVQRALRKLQALGLLQRERVPQSDANRTGRVLRLRWRSDRPLGHGCPALRSPANGPPHSPVTDEGISERERERPESGPGPESPSPTAEELELWRGWAAGSNAILARIGRAALATAGVAQPPCPLLRNSQETAMALEGPEDHGPAASRAHESPCPRIPRPEDPRAREPEAPQARGITGPQVPRPAVSRTPKPSGPSAPGRPGSRAPRPVGSQARKPGKPKARDAGDLAIPWASVFAGLGDRRPGGSRHPRPIDP